MCDFFLLQGELSSKAAVPSETLTQISTMEKSIDALMADLAALSSQVAQGSSTGRLEELGSQVAQMRERLAEMDRAVTALANTVAQRPETAEADEAPPAFVVSELLSLSARVFINSVCSFVSCHVFLPYSLLLFVCYCQDVDTFMELQAMVSDMKQHQDRLLDTAAHLSNELGVNQEHVKVGGSAKGVQWRHSAAQTVSH